MNLRTITAGVMLNAIILTLSCLATAVKLPDERTLERKFEDVGMTHFAEKTKIANTLANQELEPKSVFLKIQSAVANYSELHPNLPVSIMRDEYACLVTTEVLKDHPEALQELAKDGTCKEKIFKLIESMHESSKSKL